MTTRRDFIAATAAMAAVVPLASGLSLVETKEEKGKEKGTEEVQLVFAQTAEDFKADDRTLPLVNVGKQILYFSDQSVRMPFTFLKAMLKLSGLFMTSVALINSVQAQQGNEELAKQAQNPVANLISVPFQNNHNFDVGPLKKNQNVLNIQPVIPIHLNADWNLITRTIVPVISQPEFVPGEGRTNGLGDTQLTAFLSPARTEGLIWGIGPVVQIPTNTNDLDSDKWGLGLSAVALRMDGPWVYGALVNNIWSIAFAGPDGPDAPPYNQLTLQPFLNYNFPGGLYLTASPIITANWKAEESKDVWTVPLGGGIGKLWRIDRLPVNTQLQGFYNAEKPEFGADWTLRLQVQFLFPK